MTRDHTDDSHCPPCRQYLNDYIVNGCFRFSIKDSLYNSEEFAFILMFNSAPIQGRY